MLPASFSDSGNHSMKRCLPEGKPRYAEFAKVGMATTRDLTSVNDTNGAGIPGKFRQSLVVAFTLQLCPQFRVFLDSF